MTQLTGWRPPGAFFLPQTELHKEGQGGWGPKFTWSSGAVEQRW